MRFASRFVMTAAPVAVAVLLALTAATAGLSGTSGIVSEPARYPALLPNMTPLQANDLHIERSDGTRWLRLESGLANVGRGPMEVRPNDTKRCPRDQRHASQVIYHDVDGSRFFKRSVDTQSSRRSAGCMVFHRLHDHWHFAAASRFTLRRAEDARTSSSPARR